METLEVERCRAGNDQLHSLRGLGGGRLFAVPQLSIQALTSSQGTPMRVRSNSASRLASAAKASGDQGSSSQLTRLPISLPRPVSEADPRSTLPTPPSIRL